jgi:hypothetical protein
MTGNQKKVGDILGNLVAPSMPAPSPVDIARATESAGVQGPVGAPPIDGDAIKAKAGAPPEVANKQPQQPQVDPMMMKEIEVIHLKIKLAETEEELLVQRIQDVRRRRQELAQIQRNLLARVKGQIVVGPNGNPQPAPG